MHIVGMVACAVLVAGCTGITTGEPSPEAPSGQSAVSQNLYGAPPVANPIDSGTYGRYERDPCSVLPKRDMRQIGPSLQLATEPKPDRTSVGGTCNYDSLTDFSLGSGGINFVPSSGLSSIYVNREMREQRGVFREIPPIEGHPALVSGLIDTTDTGRCTVAVGTSDRQSINFSASFSDYGVGKPRYYDRPCAAARVLAEAGIRNMKGGS